MTNFKGLFQTSGVIFALIGIFFVLFAILFLLQERRRHPVYEGFDGEGVTEKLTNISTYLEDTQTKMKNPLRKMVRKLTKMSRFFMKPQVWQEAFQNAQMSITDLARMQLRKDAATT